MLFGPKEVSGNLDLTTTAIDGRITVARGDRSGSAKPEAKVERMEAAVMRANFMIWR